MLAADRMVTFDPPTSLQFEGEDRKIFAVTEHLVIAGSGTTHEIADVIDRVRAKSDLESLPIIEVAKRLNEAREEVRCDILEQRFTRPILGLTLSKFRELLVATPAPALSLLLEVQNKIAQHPFGLSLLLAGIERKRVHLYGIDFIGVTSAASLGYTSIGSGWLQALVSLASYRHLKAFKLPQAIYSAFEAKKAAELAFGVGRTTDLVVIRPDMKVEFLDEEAINGLQRIYETRRPPLLSDNDQNIISRMLKDGA